MIKWCDYCGKKFEAVKDTAKYCSNACRTKSYRQRNGLPSPDFNKINSPAMPPENEKQYLLLKEELTEIIAQEIAYERNYKSMFIKFEEANNLLETSPSNWSRDNFERRKKEFIETKNHLIEQQNKRIIAESSIRLLRRNLDKEKIVGEGLIASAEEISRLNNLFLDFNGKWLKYFGSPQVNFFMLISGSPKSGKSTLALIFSNYLKQFGNVMFFAVDEKFGLTLQNKIIRYKISEIQFSKAKNKYEISNVLADSDYNFVFIDSLNQTGMSFGDLEELRFIYPKTSFIIILQTVGSREHKSNHLFKHACDIYIDVNDGMAMVKNKIRPNIEFDVFELNEDLF